MSAAADRRSPIFVSLFAACALLAGPARADDDSDRRDLLEEIDKKLQAAKSKLDDCRSESNDSSIKAADRHVEAVKDLLTRLERVKGSDSKASEALSRYPRHIDEFMTSTKALLSMREKQGSNKKPKEACEKHDKDLVDKARGFERAEDPAGLDKLPDLAIDAKREAGRTLDEVDRIRRDMEGWKTRVHGFDASDGKWSDLRTALRRASDVLWDKWRDDAREVEDACKDVKAGVDHPVVREVLGRLSSSAAGRRDLVQWLDRQVDELADKINAVPNASTASATDHIRDRLNAIDRSLATLAQTRDADVSARKITDEWPRIAREAREVLESLRELKTGQHELDDAPGRCRARETDLDNFIRKHGAILSGASKIRDYAAELRAPVVFEADEAKKRLAKLQAAHDLVLRFSRSEGRWSEVTQAYRGAADKLLAFYKDKHDKLLADCKGFLAFPEHPTATAAIDALKGHAVSLGDALERDVDGWMQRAAEVARLDCEGMKKMSEAYCRGDWGANDAIDTNTHASRVAADLASNMATPLENLITEYAPLLARVDTLAGQPNLQKRVETLQKLLKKEKARLDRVVKAGHWRGAYDPNIFFAQQYGKDMHRQMHAQHQCSVPLTPDSDAKFPGRGHSKPDCISLQGCMIYEFKPDSPGGKTAGADQIKNYGLIVPNYYNGVLRGQTKLDPALGDVGFMARLVDRCLVGGEIKLSTAVAYYDSRKCEMVYECL